MNLSMSSVRENSLQIERNFSVDTSPLLSSWAFMHEHKYIDSDKHKHMSNAGPHALRTGNQ